MSKAKDLKSLDLSHTLRDLARLRASDFDLSSLLSCKAQSANPTDGSPVDRSVEESYLFAQEARSALKLHNRNDLVTLGGQVEDVRSRLDELVTGLDARDASFVAQLSQLLRRLSKVPSERPSSAMEEQLSPSLVRKVTQYLSFVEIWEITNSALSRTGKYYEKGFLRIARLSSAQSIREM
ncbi:hypothetical protein C0995_016010 [Termitomyces sp. Mi166|nr:hypothetical protein C0995_016010 [Termitomyces sp. Mi166\